jgi:hypothetical protein
MLKNLHSDKTRNITNLTVMRRSNLSPNTEILQKEATHKIMFTLRRGKKGHTKAFLKQLKIHIGV